MKPAFATFTILSVLLLAACGPNVATRATTGAVVAGAVRVK